MEKRCAWCNKDFFHTDAAVPVSHGICKGCADEIEVNLKIPVRSFLDNLDTPVLIVDTDRNIMAGNHLTKKELSQEVLVKSKAGSSVSCKNALLPEGCGNTAFCGGCELKEGIFYTHNTGNPLDDVKVVVEKLINNRIIETDVLFSTEKAGDYVLIQLKDVK